MKKWLGAVLGLYAILSFAGCGAPKEQIGTFDPMAGGDSIKLPAKADGLIVDLSLGQTLDGHVGGTALALYSLQLKQGSFIRADVKRKNGDLQPQAFLYANINALGHDRAFLPPEPGYSYGNGNLSLGWQIFEEGEYILVIKAYRDASTGDFTLAAYCQSGTCEEPEPQEPQEPNTPPTTGPVPVTEEQCLFSLDAEDLETQPGLTFGASLTATVANAGNISLARQAQMIKGMQLRQWPVTTYEEAVGYTDDSEFAVTPFQAQDGRDFVLYSYHAGDNPMSFIYADVMQPVLSFCDDWMCSCTLEPGGDCLWEEDDMLDIIEHPDHQVEDMIRYDKNNFHMMPPILKEQLRIGMEQLVNESIATAEEAFLYCDYGPSNPEVSTQKFTHKNGLSFVYFDFTQGENGFGFAFMDAETEMAYYGDGYLASCSAPKITP